MSPVVVHLVELPTPSFASQSNAKFTCDEKALPLLDSHPSVETFQKKAKYVLDTTEAANKRAVVNNPVSPRGNSTYRF